MLYVLISFIYSPLQVQLNCFSISIAMITFLGSRHSQYFSTENGLVPYTNHNYQYIIPLLSADLKYTQFSICMQVCQLYYLVYAHNKNCIFDTKRSTIAWGRAVGIPTQFFSVKITTAMCLSLTLYILSLIYFKTHFLFSEGS